MKSCNDFVSVEILRLFLEYSKCMKMKNLKDKKFSKNENLIDRFQDSNHT